MNEITLRDYRCFRGEQTARLAPLTLLVGENSTGKTSFMAMIRALWDVAYRTTVPDFKEAPYDLGSFAEIAHHRGGRGGRADSFEGGFRIGGVEGDNGNGLSFHVTFEERGTAPIPTVREVRNGRSSLRAEQGNGLTKFVATSDGGEWKREYEVRGGGIDDTELPSFLRVGWAFQERVGKDDRPSDEQFAAIQHLVLGFRHPENRPFAGAPVRSKPRRTYDPALPSRDPEGEHMPAVLAHLYRHQDSQEWSALKGRVEEFGTKAGLFDELSIRSLGRRTSEPFQIRVRKWGRNGGNVKGPWRNLIDVGYGVSQVLPLVTELLRADAPSISLLQQPEVHLHPSAQAALGTLFCCQAREDRQLLVETHSDHLLNRVRMDVRDGSTPLSAEQVSILYFERHGLEVRIHSLRIDDAGNVRDAPASYGRFFMDETERSLAY